MSFESCFFFTDTKNHSKERKKIQFLECNLIPAMISLQNNVTETISTTTIEHHKETLTIWEIIITC
jgi:hypothetical protein